MKASVIILYIFLSGGLLQAQQPDGYRADLQKLDAVIRKLPSFKTQVKGKQKEEYTGLYQELREDTALNHSSFEDFLRLVKLFYVIKDNHIGFYQLLPNRLTPTTLSDSSVIRAYRQTEGFLSYPRFTGNLDSLEQILAKKAKDSVEGIYYYAHYLKVGLFRTTNPQELMGVVLNTALGNWEKGQVAMYLTEYEPNYFRAVYGHPVSKNLVMHQNEKFRNQELIGSYFYSSVSQKVYSKNPDAADYSRIPRSAATYQFSSIDPSIQYLRIGSFSTYTTNVAASNAFYTRIKDSLTAPNLIVDVRNDTGGAEKVAKPYLSLLKAYAKKGKIYLLLNHDTESQGEIFTLQLKKLRGVSTWGQATMGKLAYGSNYGTRVTLPSKQYEIYITDMNNGATLRSYENKGVIPDNELSLQSDWIQQLTEAIKKQ